MPENKSRRQIFECYCSECELHMIIHLNKMLSDIPCVCPFCDTYSLETDDIKTTAARG